MTLGMLASKNDEGASPTLAAQKDYCVIGQLIVLTLCNSFLESILAMSRHVSIKLSELSSDSLLQRCCTFPKNTLIDILRRWSQTRSSRTTQGRTCAVWGLPFTGIHSLSSITRTEQSLKPNNCSHGGLTVSWPWVCTEAGGTNVCCCELLGWEYWRLIYLCFVSIYVGRS